MENTSYDVLSTQERVQLCVLSYGRVHADRVVMLMASTHLDNKVEVSTSDLGRHDDIDCDIAVALCNCGDDPRQYISDLAWLHVVKNIPTVFSVIDPKAKAALAPLRREMATAGAITLPAASAELTQALTTHIMSLKTGNRRRGAAQGVRSHALGEILFEHNLITPLQLKKALDHQETTGQRLGDALVDLGYIDEDQKMQFLAMQLDVPLATAQQYASADITVVSLIPERLARRYECVALARDGDELLVAMVDVLNLNLLDTLRDTTELTIRPALGKRDDIIMSVERYYRDIASNRQASDLLQDDETEVEYVREREESPNLEEIAAAGAELGVVKLVNLLIANAIKDKASDIHIEPLERELIVRYRIDGDLRKVMSPPKRTHQAIVTRIKILSNLNIAERRLPQDGRMVIKTGAREVDIRVSVLPTIFGEKVVLRILDKEAFERSVTNLGFDDVDRGTFNAQICKPYGMIIVTGPTGSGKSTTLYAALQSIKNVRRNIVTVEDPVEFHMEGVSQVHVNSKIGLTFAAALRSILRQDPDIVLIGEIRDGETADIAIKMALTGHLVFSTLHTNDAAAAIARFVDIGIPPLLLGSSLNLVVAQRLVRKICPRCKTEYEPEPEVLRQLRLPSVSDTRFYTGKGCVNCNGTGYSGRTGIFEMIPISKDIRKLVLRNASTMEIQEQAEKEGMRTLRRAGIELALRGVTTMEQVIAVTTEM